MGGSRDTEAIRAVVDAARMLADANAKVWKDIHMSKASGVQKKLLGSVGAMEGLLLGMDKSRGSNQEDGDGGATPRTGTGGISEGNSSKAEASARGARRKRASWNHEVSSWGDQPTRKNHQDPLPNAIWWWGQPLNIPDRELGAKRS